MSSKIKLAGIFSVLILAVVFYQAFKTPETLDGPVLVPLYESTDNISLRGLHATDDSVVVVGGSSGVFGFSLDAGIHWIFTQLPGAPESQFRSVWAFNDHTFLAVSAGAPSYIYRTEDRGQHWSRVFSDTAKATFLDGIVFANDSLGWVYGDPVDSAFKLLRTQDGGKSWQSVPGPLAIDGEASFAASGSAIAYRDGLLTIVSGGTVSRMHTSSDQGNTWAADHLELKQGLPSQGAFAHAWVGDKLFIVGGDYMNDTSTSETALVIDLATGDFDAATNARLEPLPYTSDVVGDGTYTYFAGTTGVRSLDSTLEVMDTAAMHALTYSGKYVFASGPHGRIGRVYNGDVAGLNDLVNQVKSAQKAALKHD